MSQQLGFALPAIAQASASSGPAAPFVLAGSAAVAAIMAWFARKGPKQKVASTRVVDEVEPLLARNRDEFLAGPATAARKQAALEAFDALWAEVVARCSDPALGAPGQRCISDRQRGGRWDWAALYRDPIDQTAVESMADPADLRFLLPALAIALGLLL